MECSSSSRLHRYLTFTICRYLDKCTPSIIQVRIPNGDDAIPQYDINSFVFLNGYIRDTHVDNCSPMEQDVEECNMMSNMYKQLAERKQVPMWQLDQKKQGDERHLHKHRDPFMARELDFELKQICQAFDLLEFGVEMAFLLIKLLSRDQIESLWKALGIVLEHMPYERARYVLVERREDLRRAGPQKMKALCDRIVRRSKFSIHICFFLAQYMEVNASRDRLRGDLWTQYSKDYEAEAGRAVNEIESDHLLALLLDVPIRETGREKVSLLQVALEQGRSIFLSNERIDGVMTHVWQTPFSSSPKDPIERHSFSSYKQLKLLLDQPFRFYVTPMGYFATTMILHALYIVYVFTFMVWGLYLEDDMTWGEGILWVLNMGYLVNELFAMNKGIRVYFRYHL